MLLPHTFNKVHTFSEVGGHARNEDAFEVRPHPADEGCLLVAVADGQGGRAGGAAASALACRTCMDAASALPPASLLSPHAWTGILRQADAAVERDPDAGMTTLIAFCIVNSAKFLCGASNGDSAVYLRMAGRPGVILTERQHKDPPIGSGAADPVSFTARLTVPWLLLALTDGVWKYAGWDGVRDAAAQHGGDELIPILRNKAALPNGQLQDDFTVVAVWDDGP